MKKALKEELDQLIQRANYLNAQLQAFEVDSYPLIFLQIEELRSRIEALCFTYFKISEIYGFDGDIEKSYEYAKLVFQAIINYKFFQDEKLLLGALSNMADQLIAIRVKNSRKLATEDQEIVRLLSNEKKDLIGEYYLILTGFAVGLFRDKGISEARILANEYSERSLDYLSEQQDPLKMQFALSVYFETTLPDVDNPWKSIEEIEKITKRVQKIIKKSTNDEGRNQAKRFYINLKEGLANHYFNNGLLDQAIENYKEVKKIRKETNDIAGQISISISLGNCQIQTGDFDEALSTCRSVLAIAESLGDWSSLAQIHRIIAFALLNQKNKDEGKKELDKSEYYLRKLSPGIGVLHMWLSFARLKKQSNLKYKSYYDEAIKMAKELNNREGSMQINYELGVAIYQDNPNDQSAKTYFMEAYKLAREQNNTKISSAATKYLDILTKN